MLKVTVPTHGEKFYSITSVVKGLLKDLNVGEKSGILYLFCPHTSCGLLITESFEDSAVADMEEFMKRLAPRAANFITHTTEGPDDSPSHMKSMLLSPSLTLFVEKGQLTLGQWQGLFLCEFRDDPKERKIWAKFLAE